MVNPGTINKTFGNIQVEFLFQSFCHTNYRYNALYIDE